jgi:hypothetical protein
MDGECNTPEKMKSAHKILVRIPERRGLLGKIRSGQEIINLDDKEI